MRFSLFDGAGIGAREISAGSHSKIVKSQNRTEILATRAI